MKIPGEKVIGNFITRPNRFEALVEIEGEIENVHVPNTGRMAEMLHPGARVILIKSRNPARKTKYSMNFIYKKDHLICINSILANKVFEEGVKNGSISLEHEGKSSDINIIREVAFGSSRLDFLIEGLRDNDNTFVEVKCCTYEENNQAMFPDAPTERGRRHIDELIKAKEEGFGAAIIILSFMDYVEEFSPNYNIDKKFGLKLENAYNRGVNLKVYRCCICTDEIRIDREIPFHFIKGLS